MKNIALSKGMVAVVSDEDYERVAKIKWYARDFRHRGKRRFYAYNDTHGLMHRFLFGGSFKVIDHKNGNPLDNRRENLRGCTQQQNCFNQAIQKRNKSSRFKGVSLNKQNQKWRSYIKKSGIKFTLGEFTDEVSAAKAYNRKSLELFGEFARLNPV